MSGFGAVRDGELFCESCAELMGLETQEVGESDSPDHCASGRDCVDFIELGVPESALRGAESSRIGALVGDELTSDGRRYVISMIRRRHDHGGTTYQGALHDFWREVFDISHREIAPEQYADEDAE